MEEKFLQEEELKEDINWLFLANLDTKNNGYSIINIKPLLFFSNGFFLNI